MEWFNGGIPQAIQAAKIAKGIFAVVVVNGDEQSEAFLSMLNEDDVKSRLNLTSSVPVVAIKLENGSPPCAQFSQLYPIILIPSIYFIDSTSGVDIEVTGGQITKENLVESIEKANEKMKVSLSLQGAAAVASFASTAAADDVISPRGLRVEQARQALREAVPSPVPAPSTSSDRGVPSAAEESSPTPTSAMTMEERVARAKQLLAERQAQKAMEEEDIQKSKERERRELGKTLTEQKLKREDEERIKAAEERRKDKEEDKLAMEKIRAQIAQDREERAARFNAEKQAELAAKADREKKLREEESAEAARLSAERCKSARVQLRYPDGRSRTKVFPADSVLQVVYDFANDEVAATFGRDNFSLSTTYPARQLDRESRDAPLRDVGLVPTGTVMIIPRGSSSIGALAPSSGNIMSFVWLLLTPITVIFNMVASFFTSSPTSSSGTSSASTNDARSVAELRASAAERRLADTEPSTSSSGRPQTAYQRRTPAAAGIRKDGNVARLGNMSDSDDENSTYNGNSTQQM